MAKAKKKTLGAPKKAEELKLKKRLFISITDTDYADFLDYKSQKRIDIESMALRQIFRDAIDAFRKTKKKR